MTRLEPITNFGWNRLGSLCVLSAEQQEEIEELEFQIADHLVSAVPNCYLLHPRQLIPTQAQVDEELLQGLTGTESLPPILLLRFDGALYIYDGHHRATRALLDNELVLAVVYRVN